MKLSLIKRISNTVMDEIEVDRDGNIRQADTRPCCRRNKVFIISIITMIVVCGIVIYLIILGWYGDIFTFPR